MPHGHAYAVAQVLLLHTPHVLDILFVPAGSLDGRRPLTKA